MKCAVPKILVFCNRAAGLTLLSDRIRPGHNPALWDLWERKPGRWMKFCVQGEPCFMEC